MNPIPPANRPVSTAESGARSRALASTRRRLVSSTVRSFLGTLRVFAIRAGCLHWAHTDD
jgi:hypothetical protein